MVALSTDHFCKVGEPGGSTVLAAPGHSIGGTSINVDSTSLWPTDTGVIFAIDTTTLVSGVETRVAGTYTVWEGVVSSGTSIGSMVLRTGTDQNYSAGATTRVYILPTSARENRLVDGLSVQHKQTGAHSAITADSAVIADGGNIEVDHILEAASAHGVDIDGVLLKDGKVSTAGAVENLALATGVVVQVASDNFSAVATGTTTIPQDDTVPQITEGTEFMTTAIVPKSATNILVIEATIMVSSDTAGRNLIAALFQDSTAGALAANGQFGDDGAASVLTQINIKHRMVAGTTSATTFRIRVGGQAACTVSFNGVGGARIFGGITKSCLTITEYKAS